MARWDRSLPYPSRIAFPWQVVGPRFDVVLIMGRSQTKLGNFERPLISIPSTQIN